jgi:hypothetical protein
MDSSDPRLGVSTSQIDLLLSYHNLPTSTGKPITNTLYPSALVYWISLPLVGMLSRSYKRYAQPHIR